jgi:iron complex transport system substrate-binding protein
MRIASLLSSSTEMLFGLGLGAQVVAVSHECDYPEAARHLPRATRSRIDSAQPSAAIDEQVRALAAAGEALYEVDGELLGRLEPNLIVTQAQCDVCAVRYQDVLKLVSGSSALRGAAVLALNPTSLDEILDDIQRVATAAGAEEAGRSYVAELGSRIRKAESRWLEEFRSEVLKEFVNLVRPGVPYEMPASNAAMQRAFESRPRVVCLEWLAPLMTAGNWTPDLIKQAGGECCLAAACRHSGYVEWAKVAACNPDVLLIAPCGFDLQRSQAEAQTLWQLPGFADLAAVASGRAYVLDGNAYLNRSGPRIVDSLEILAGLFRG